MLVFLSSPVVFPLMVFMGQAHFVLAYWYKFEKISGLTRSPFFILWASLVVVLMLLGIYEVFPMDVWFITAALLFIAHHVYDDLSLSVGVVTPLQIVLLFSGIVLLYLTEVTEDVFGILLTNNALIVLAAIAIITPFFALRAMRSNAPTLFKVYIGIVTIVSVLAILASRGIAMQLLLTFFIFTHYFLWYLEYGRRVAPSKEKTKKYLIRAIVINASLFAVWYVSHSGVPIPLYDYFFGEMFFYIWTFLHIVFSFIPATLGRGG